MHLGLGNGSSKETQQLDPRESRRLFKENVRTDWNYPALPAYRAENDVSTSVPQHSTGGFKIHKDTPRELLDEIIPEVTDWRARHYGSSDTESDDEVLSKRKSKKSTDFFLDEPNIIAEEHANRMSARKRKRQRLLAEEMSWNEGLQHFVNRRDTWTGAKTASQVQLMSMSKSAVSSLAEAYNGSVSSSPRSSTSVNTDLTHQSRPSTATTSPDPAAMSMKEQLPALDMLLPIMSQLLAAHPVRRKIGPSMYSEIYAKIIVQSRTPAIPINLLNLIRALVQGWKADGEWPPKLSAPEQSLTRKKVNGIKQGAVKAVTRVLKITSSESLPHGKEKKAA